MAEVKMDLAELKQLENKIESLEREKQDLIDKQHQVVVYHKYFNGKIKPSSRQNSPQIRVEGTYFDNYGRQRSRFNDDINLVEAMQRGYVEIDLTEDSSRHTKDYVNMSEIIQQIHQEERSKLVDQIKESTERARNAEVKIETLSDDHIKEIQRINKNKFDEIEKIKEESNESISKLTKEKDLVIDEQHKAYAKLLQEFDDFKVDRKRVSLEEQVAELTKQINAYKSKSFWQRLFNK